MGLIGAILLIIFTVFHIKKGPCEWTKMNSLKRVPAISFRDNGSLDALLISIDYSLIYFKQMNPDTQIHLGEDIFLISQVVDSLIDFKKKLKTWGFTDTFFRYIEDNYYIYKSSSRRVLFTGYFEAYLKGSLTPSAIYNFPIYKRPDDLVEVDLSKFNLFNNKKVVRNILKGRLTKDNHVVPYYSRKEIDSDGSLAGRDIEIAWIDDPADVFFLQIQGSGIVELENNEKLRVNYDNSNGHPYRAIGQLLLDRGLLHRNDISMQSIRKYIENNPEEREEIFNYNPSYVFFKIVEEGPIGYIKVPVTPYRSIATDKDIFPLGMLCYVETELPVFDDKGELSGWREHRGFVLNQDTGGAIRTPGRVDFFTGMGEQSELTAGHLKREGMFYFLLKARGAGTL